VIKLLKVCLWKEVVVERQSLVLLQGSGFYIVDFKELRKKENKSEK
jgi:predicted nucleic acid-binding Zn ribbon protein